MLKRELEYAIESLKRDLEKNIKFYEGMHEWALEDKELDARFSAGLRTAYERAIDMTKRNLEELERNLSK